MKKNQSFTKTTMQCRNSKSVCNKIRRSVRIYIQGKETEDAIAAAEVVIGEPEEEEILESKKIFAGSS